MEELVRKIEPLKGRSLPFVDEQRIELGPLHGLLGNPQRWDVGPITLRADDEWRRKLRRGTRLATTLATYPLLLKYGYLSVRPEHASLSGRRRAAGRS
jgi:hypothetical protein